MPKLSIQAFVQALLIPVWFAASACGGGESDAVCANARLDQGETDIDCGGTCDPCGVGQGCLVETDCSSGICQNSVCLPTESCDDRSWNGDETDMDCGGSCAPCATGKNCLDQGDCLSGTCINGVCRDPACNDGLHNGQESDLDCGGPCEPCANDQSCNEATDCLTLTCILGLCQDPACDDGLQNGQESDLDCGGPCAPCLVGQTCEQGADCASEFCFAGVCAEATCNDGVLSGEETDVDCGGNCQPCTTGMTCLLASDCSTGNCQQGICALPASCFDHSWNGDETDVDCGGSCDPCATGDDCQQHADCLSATCINGICRDPSCSDGVSNGGESDTDCGGPCAACANDLHCREHTDCQQLTCIGGICLEPACDDGLANGDESDVDCGGSCPPCEPVCGNGIIEPPDEECDPLAPIGATCADYGFAGDAISCSDDCKIDIAACGCVWETEMVTSPISRPSAAGSSQSSFTGIDVDSQGRVHMAFIDTTNDEIRYALKEAGIWSFEVIQSGSADIVAVSLATDSQDHPHIAYMRSSVHKVFHAVRNADGWTSEEVGFTQTHCVDVAMQIDSSDVVHIAYTHDIPLSSARAHVSYANNSTGSWDVITWGPDANSGEPRAVDIDVDGFGSVHIVYAQHTLSESLWNVEPRYISNSTGIWKETYLTRADNSYVGYYASVDADSQGTVWSSYYDKDAGQLLVSNNSSGAFPAPEGVDNVGDVGQYTAVGITSDDSPHVAYMDVTNDQLKHTTWDGSAWSTGVIDTNGATGRDVDMVAAGKELHVSYTAIAPDMELRYARMVCPLDVP